MKQQVFGNVKAVIMSTSISRLIHYKNEDYLGPPNNIQIKKMIQKKSIWSNDDNKPT